MDESDFENDPELKQLRDEFIDSLPPRLEQLTRFSAAGDLVELRRLVHSLAGVAGAYGFVVLGDLAGEFDDWFEAGELSGLAQWVSRLDAALRIAYGESGRKKHL
jgi:HPt (histidine-containing phosphotransfer) domain-containing protein